MTQMQKEKEEEKNKTRTAACVVFIQLPSDSGEKTQEMGCVSPSAWQWGLTALCFRECRGKKRSTQPVFLVEAELLISSAHLPDESKCVNSRGGGRGQKSLSHALCCFSCHRGSLSGPAPWSGGGCSMRSDVRDTLRAKHSLIRGTQLTGPRCRGP